MGIVLQTWALHRLSALPAHAIIVFERAEGRVRIWREKNAEPPIVLRIIVHVDAVPTAISSGSDAYWLPALQRWASPSEVARLFGLKAKHSAARALQSRFVSDRTAVVCAGKAVHADSATCTLLIGIDNLKAPLVHPRYAACSGIDTFAAAMESVYGKHRTYVQATESHQNTADILHATYKKYGLLRSATLSLTRASKRTSTVQLTFGS